MLARAGRRTPCGLTTSHPFAGGVTDPFSAMHDERPARVSRHPRRLYTNKQRQRPIESRIDCFNIADVDEERVLLVHMKRRTELHMLHYRLLYTCTDGRKLLDERV
ncbi:hypothetical protein NDU88_002382 [Pleurodeles waltl]|uniref:Uncharacterized protein n=1 Tax=Pleurodeles waltl TaxID=8319 RepID=A0AAV7Q6H6_PLEWA|nr:hypothetical protein NDU88_002382 [Pleurodeles waltl]